ncbi:hypothetical protein JTE90_028999 [Oedothorax gibbosus]|uniref:Uncharacterized protein n=1 Tax=Oedothorax gibbosus TaxID=931172 RepID=A0AAV6VJE1_9ARAC|nr:hypothetical protein JTE90_028999 [Oedothorax gibbosus]
MDIRRFLKCDGESLPKRPRMETCSINSSPSPSNHDLTSLPPSETPTSSNKTSEISCASRDLGKYLGKISRIDDLLKYHLLTDPWVPGDDYKFPTSSHMKRGREEKRRANIGHLKTYNWLVFSDEKKGLLCKYCCLFAHQKLVGGQKTVPIQKLIIEPLRKFAKLIGKDGDM